MAVLTFGPGAGWTVLSSGSRRALRGQEGVWVLRLHSPPGWAGTGWTEGCLGSIDIRAGRALVGQYSPPGWAVSDWAGGSLGGTHLRYGRSLTGWEGVWAVLTSGMGGL